MSYNGYGNNNRNGGGNEDTREVEAMRKMFVGGLNRETTEETFFDYFGQYGNMVDKVIIKDTTTKQSRGFGFITYDHSDSVEAVFQARPHAIDGKTLDVKRAMPREFNTATSHSKTQKLFVGGITQELTPEELQTYIESRHSTSFGTVDKINFIKDQNTQQNKGFGFLECSSTDFADRLTISEAQFMLKGKSMSIKKAEPKQGEGGNDGNAPSGGSFRGRGGGRGGRGGAPRGRGRGNTFNQGYAQNNSYNQSTGYPTTYGNSGSNNYNQGYNQSGGYNQSQGYGGQPQQTGGYNQQGGYNQASYGNQQTNYGSYGANNQSSGWSGGNDRYQPY